MALPTPFGSKIIHVCCAYNEILANLSGSSRLDERLISSHGYLGSVDVSGVGNINVGHGMGMT